MRSWNPDLRALPPGSHLLVLHGSPAEASTVVAELLDGAKARGDRAAGWTHTRQAQRTYADTVSRVCPGMEKTIHWSPTGHLELEGKEIRLRDEVKGFP